MCLPCLRAKTDSTPAGPLSEKEDPATSEPAAAEEDSTEGYAGKVDKKMDHKTYMPAAWRVSRCGGILSVPHRIKTTAWPVHLCEDLG